MKGRTTFRGAPGWTRLSAPGRKCETTWLHESSGWIVKHCGHPTANWPYYLEHESNFAGRIVVSFNGLGFSDLLAATSAVERISAGELEVTTSRCVNGIARALCTAMGEPAPSESAEQLSLSL